MQQGATASASASASATDWMEQLEQPAQLQGGDQTAASPAPSHFDRRQTATRSLNATDPGVYTAGSNDAL